MYLSGYCVNSLTNLKIYGYWFLSKLRIIKKKSIDFLNKIILDRTGVRIPPPENKTYRITRVLDV